MAIIIGSHTVMASETVSKATRGSDPAKPINGRKRHLMVVCSAIIQMTRRLARTRSTRAC